MNPVTITDPSLFLSALAWAAIFATLGLMWSLYDGVQARRAQKK